MVKGSAKTYFNFLLLSDSYNNILDLGTISLYSAGISALESPCTISEKGKIWVQTAIFSSRCVSYIIISDS